MVAVIFTPVLDFLKLSADYQQTLLRQVVPFWLKHSRDERCGGYFDVLSATGQPVDSDKSVFLQAQQVWAFAWLYNTLDGRADWLAHARHGGNFLNRFAHTDNIHCYGHLNRRGLPTAPATDDQTDALVVAAYSQLHRATGQDEWAMLARHLFGRLVERRKQVQHEQLQAIGGFWSLRHLSEPIALLRATFDMQPLLDEETFTETIGWIYDEILLHFLDRRTDTLRETILADGAFVNTPTGRRLNVGLTFQTITYLLSSCTETGNRKLAMRVVSWALRLCELAWDETTGGLNQYADQKNEPIIFAEWQQKWAWIQLEALTALIKGYFQTRHPDCPTWFKRIHDYAFGHFPDTQNGGWHLALDAGHRPLLATKAIPTVGCFSLVRCLTEIAQTLTQCGQLQPLGRNIRLA